MDIVFVKPSMTAERSADAMEPLVFGLLSGLTPPDFNRTLFDEIVEEIDYNHPADLVALSVETFTAKRAYQIAMEYNKRGVPVVMGGYHPSFSPHEALQFADAIVIGDAESVWRDLLNDFKEGTPRRIYRGEMRALHELHFDRNIFTSKNYSGLVPVQFGRGCGLSCDFCSIHALYGRTLRLRPVSEVVTEVDSLRHRPVLFVDDNFHPTSDQSRKLMTELIPVNARWVCQMTPSEAQDDSVLELMRQSGCFAVYMGFESLEDGSLKQIQKPWRDAHRRYRDIVSRFRNHGIMIVGTFVFGYDHDTEDTFDKILDFSIESKLTLASFHPLAPTPGTSLYSRLKNQGRLIQDPWWLDSEYRYGKSMFHPMGMTAEQLESGCYRLRSDFYRFGCIMKRVTAVRSNARSLFNLAIYFKANLILRNVVHSKQGSILGDGSEISPVFPSGTRQRSH